MKILIGVDDSPFSTAAIEHVKGAAWPAGSQFIVVSTCEPIWIGPGEMASPGPIAELNRQQEQFHREIAEKSAKTLSDAGLKATGRVEHGDPRSILVEAARREGADLLVVGSHGRSGMAKLMIGSVASHVIAHAPCSVLVVKRPA